MYAFVDMPVELLTCILTNLNFDDLINMCKTSKYYRDYIYSRVFINCYINNNNLLRDNYKTELEYMDALILRKIPITFNNRFNFKCKNFIPRINNTNTQDNDNNKNTNIQDKDTNTNTNKDTNTNTNENTNENNIKLFSIKYSDSLQRHILDKHRDNYDVLLEFSKINKIDIILCNLLCVDRKTVDDPNNNCIINERVFNVAVKLFQSLSKRNYNLYLYKVVYQLLMNDNKSIVDQLDEKLKIDYNALLSTCQMNGSTKKCEFMKRLYDLHHINYTNNIIYDDQFITNI